MKRKMLIGQILMLLMSVISSSLANENLKCYTDGIKLITCVWNTSSVEDRFQITPTTKCSLQSIDNNFIRKIPLSVNLEPLGDSQSKLRQGTLQFAEHTLTDGSLKVPLNVRCENITNLLETIPKFYTRSFVRLYPPEKPVVKDGSVTWKQGSPHSEFVSAVKYKVQWGLLENSWEKNQVALTEETKCELPFEKLIKGRQYVVRVQAAPNNDPRFWSEWSPVTQWESTVGLPPPPSAAKVQKKKKSTKKASVMDQISTNKQGVRKRVRRVHGRKTSRKNRVTVKDKQIRNALEVYRKKQKKSQLDANLWYFLRNSYKMEESCTKKITEQSVGRQSRHKPEKLVKKQEKRPIFTEAEFQKFQKEYFSKL